jgi:hypothetical protein
MAQLKEDEWPQDGEPTTSEREGDAFKEEGTNPPRRKTDQPDDRRRAAYDAVITNLDPDQPID